MEEATAAKAITLPPRSRVRGEKVKAAKEREKERAPPQVPTQQSTKRPKLQIAPKDAADIIG